MAKKQTKNILLVGTILFLLIVSIFVIISLNKSDIQSSDNSIYRNSRHNFEIKIPEGWNIDESGRLGTIVFFLNPTPDENSGELFYANINILSRSLQSVGVRNLEEYVNLDKEMLLKYKEEVIFISDTPIVIDDKYEGRILVLTFTHKGVLYKDKHLIVIRDGIAYVIAGTTFESDWLKYEETFERSFNSFSFKK